MNLLQFTYDKLGHLCEQFDYVTFLIPANYQKCIPQYFINLLLFCIGKIVWVMLAYIFWSCGLSCRELMAVVLLRKHSILLSIRRVVIGIMSPSGENHILTSYIRDHTFSCAKLFVFSKWILNFSAGLLFVDFVIMYFILFFSNSCSLKYNPTICVVWEDLVTWLVHWLFWRSFS